MTDLRFGQKEDVHPRNVAAATLVASIPNKASSTLSPPGIGGTLAAIAPVAPVPIVVVHPQPLMRSAWRQLVDSQPDFSVVAEVGDLADFADATASLENGQRPLVVLVDLDTGNTPDMSSIANFRSTAPTVRLVIVTQYEHDACVMKALRLGVQGFVAKGTSAERLFEAVRMVGSGGSFIDVGEQRAPTSVLDQELDGSAHSRPQLSQREQDVLVLVAQGKTNDTVGKEMFISASTVKYHLNNIFQKLQATNRTDAVRISLKLGLVQEDPPELV